jgi:hypothetical protein
MICVDTLLDGIIRSHQAWQYSWKCWKGWGPRDEGWTVKPPTPSFPKFKCTISPCNFETRWNSISKDEYYTIYCETLFFRYVNNTRSKCLKVLSWTPAAYSKTEIITFYFSGSCWLTISSTFVVEIKPCGSVRAVSSAIVCVEKHFFNHGDGLWCASSCPSYQARWSK